MPPAPHSAQNQTDLNYRSLFDSIDQGFCVIEVLFDGDRPVDYRFLETNPAFTAQTGLVSPVGRAMRELAPDHEAHWFEIYGRVAKTGKPTRFEAPAAALGRWYNVYAFRVDEAQKKRVAILFNDITRRKRLEDEFRKSQERQAFMLELSDALRPVLDPFEVQNVAARMLGEYLGANRVHYAETAEGSVVIHQGYCNGLPPMVGVFRTEDFGKHLQTAYRAGRTAVCYDAKADPTITRAEEAVVTLAGYRAYVTVPLLKQGEWVGTLTAQSIAPRKWTDDEVKIVEETAERTWAAVERARAEAELVASEERLQLALSAAEMGTFVWFPQKDTGESDPRTIAIFGLAPGSTLNFARSGDMVVPEDRAKRTEALERALDPAGDGILHSEYRIIRPSDGAERWIDIFGQTQFAGEPRQAVALSGVAIDITERKRAETVIARAAARSRDEQQLALEEVERRVTERTVERDALRRRLLVAEEDERRRLSRELHDEAGQRLTALALGLQALSDVVPAGSEVDRRAVELRNISNALGQELHDLAVRLRPRTLDDFGLEAALTAYIEAWSGQSGIPVDVHARVSADRLPGQVETALYRIVQEALTNIARHSGATRASVLVERRDGHVVAVIEDNGVGFVPDYDAISGLGLLGMRERTELLGGSIEIESAPGNGGTTVFVRIPVNGGHEDDRSSRHQDQNVSGPSDA
jgi:PAS domain S-box